MLAFIIGCFVGGGSLVIGVRVLLKAVNETKLTQARIEQQKQEAEQRLAHVSRQAQAQLITTLTRQMQQRHSVTKTDPVSKHQKERRETHSVL